MPDYKMKILVVDYFSTMRRIVKNVLKQLGFGRPLLLDDRCWHCSGEMIFTALTSTFPLNTDLGSARGHG